MRKPVVTVALFVGLLLVIDRLIYAGAIFLRDNGGHPQGIDLIYDEGWDPPVVFFGDSRTAHNFDMETIEALTGLSAYNFGRNGASPEESLFMLEEYLRHHHHPHVVVYEADPRLLDSRSGIFFEEDFRDHLAVVPQLSEIIGETHPTLEQRASALALAWVLKSASIPNRLPELWSRWRERREKSEQSATAVQFYGCGPNEKLRCKYFNGAEEFLTTTGKEMTEKPMPFNIDSERMAVFNHVAALADDDGFWLLLAETPRLHGDQAYPAAAKAQADAFYCGVARAHPQALYARLTHSEGIDRDPSLYFDWTHFNARGATKMADLIAPLIAELAHGSRPNACILE